MICSSNLSGCSPDKRASTGKNHQLSSWHGISPRLFRHYRVPFTDQRLNVAGAKALMIGQRDARFADARHSRLPAWRKARRMTDAPPSPQYCSVAPHRNALPYVSSPPVEGTSCVEFARPGDDAADDDSGVTTVSATGAFAHKDRQEATSRCQNDAPVNHHNFNISRESVMPQPIVSDNNLHDMRRQNRFHRRGAFRRATATGAPGR